MSTQATPTTTTSTLVSMSSPSQNTSIASYGTPSSSSIKDRIKIFGGEPSKVQKRKDQLSKKWEKDASKKAATFGVCGRTGKDAFSKPVPPTPSPTKVEWYTSPKSKLYKKRILVC